MLNLYYNTLLHEYKIVKTKYKLLNYIMTLMITVKITYRHIITA